MYAGLRYRLSLEFPAGYPYQAPCVKFVTPCFHPNVDDQGFICMDILKDKWSALYDVRSILLSIQSLLGGGFRVVTYFCRFLAHSALYDSADQLFGPETAAGSWFDFFTPLQKWPRCFFWTLLLNL